MKAEIAAVQRLVNVDLIAERVIVALADERGAETSAIRWEQQAAAARATARARRAEIGKLLNEARAQWPERGPSAKGWGQFLKRIGLEQSTAWRYMNPGQKPEGNPADDSCGTHERDRPDPANVLGGSGEKPRGAFCTPKKWALAIGPWDLDPYSNPRSHIVASIRCMLEDGGDGFGGSAEPGSYRSGADLTGIADASTRTFWQPPYERGFIRRVVAHYGHTRFCALLRWAPDTAWFGDLWPLVGAVAFPLGERIAFETPPGVTLADADEDDDEDRGAPFPHAFYYSDPRDITPAIAESCIVLTRYQAQSHPALQIVR